MMTNHEAICSYVYQNYFLSIRFQIKGLAEAESKSINLNVVLLRYDAFYNANGILLPICPPVYSHTINNLSKYLEFANDESKN